MIEMDVQLTRDDQLVVIHDSDLDRTTTGHGPVRAHDLATLRSLDAGRWFAPGFAGERVMSLEGVLSLISGRARLNIEIKAPAPDWDPVVRQLIVMLRRHQIIASTVISCFEPEALALLRRHASDANIGILWQHKDFAAAWRWAQDLAAVSIHPYWPLISEAVVQVAHARGLQVLAWTVNEVDVMLRLLQMRVDGLISDCPERFHQLNVT